MKKILLILFILVTSFGVISCNDIETENNKPIVAVSIAPQEAFVKAVAGDLVDVITLIPPGYSPANYEPSVKIMEDLSNAEVYFTIGAPTESGNILPDINEILVVHLEDAVKDVYPDRTFSDGGRDPHIWLSIKRVKIMIQVIADTLSSIDPVNQSLFQTNAYNYISLLDQTDTQIQAKFEDFTMKTFIVFHPSYGYFADEYGINMVTLEEDGKEATIQHMNEVIDLANSLQIHTVFYQIEIDSSQVNSFAEEINGESVSLNPLSSDYINNLLEMADLIGSAMR